jgi:hypothetical protein
VGTSSTLSGLVGATATLAVTATFDDNTKLEVRNLHTHTQQLSAPRQGRVPRLPPYPSLPRVGFCPPSDSFVGRDHGGRHERLAGAVVLPGLRLGRAQRNRRRRRGGRDAAGRLLRARGSDGDRRVRGLCGGVPSRVSKPPFKTPTCFHFLEGATQNTAPSPLCFSRSSSLVSTWAPPPPGVHLIPVGTRT